MTDNAKKEYFGENSLKKVLNLVKNLVKDKADKATTLQGYGITDAKIQNGSIYLGGESIAPLISTDITSILRAGESELLITDEIFSENGDQSISIEASKFGVRMRKEPTISAGSIRLYFRPVDEDVTIKLRIL